MVRRPKYLTAARGGHRWLISYTDVLTLLLILFIAIAAQAVSQTETRTAFPEAPPHVARGAVNKTTRRAGTRPSLATRGTHRSPSEHLK